MQTVPTWMVLNPGKQRGLARKSKCTICVLIIPVVSLFFLPFFFLYFSVCQSKWTREGFLQRRQQQVDGTVLKVDALFKLAKLDVYELLALLQTPSPSIAW